MLGAEQVKDNEKSRQNYSKENYEDGSEIHKKLVTVAEAGTKKTNESRSLIAECKSVRSLPDLRADFCGPTR